jgi:hypothetical protein
MRLIVGCLFCGLLLAETAAFEFPVYRKKNLRDEAGQVSIGETGLSYRSDNGKTSLSLAFFRDSQGRCLQPGAHHD